VTTLSASRRSSRLLIATIVALGFLLVPVSPASAAPPANDHFGNARVITGRTGDAIGRTTEATGQTNEPGSLPINSIWYRWVAPQTGSVTFDTCGSNFDTYLSIYRGTAVASLTGVASDDDRDVARPGCTGDTSRVEFGVTRNVSYRIQVDGYSTDTGSVALEWAMTRCGGLFVTADVRYGQSATDGPDVIRGSDNPSALYGGGGDDTICGGKEIEAIYGEGGRDRIYGGGGGDAIYAGPGGGVIFGGEGGDSIHGGVGADTLIGGPQADSISGHGGRDQINGGPDGDTCHGGSGRDTATACETSDGFP
jgi:Ca2+-binding RTX toxin-like protein